MSDPHPNVPESIHLNQEDFKARIRGHALSRGIPMATIDRLLPIICEARPFFMFVDSYKERDVADLAQAVARAQGPSNELHCREVAEALWGLLDDIDTLSDQVRPSTLVEHERFYQKTMGVVKKRHEHLKSDGHKLLWPGVRPVTEADGAYWRARYEELCAGIETTLAGAKPAIAYERNRQLTAQVREATDALDGITEMFHPDMNYSNIRAAIRALFNVFNEVRKVRLGNEHVLTDQDLEHLRKRVSECHSLLWERIPTHLEKERALHQAEVDAKLSEHLPEQRLLLDVLMGRGPRGFPTGFKGESWGAVLLEVERLGYMRQVLERWGISPDCPRGAYPPHRTPEELHEVKPVPMLLSCPVCHTRHFDEGEFATKPHHTHACQGFVEVEGKRRRCGHVWRPALVPTVGVEALPGFLNEVTGG